MRKPKNICCVHIKSIERLSEHLNGAWMNISSLPRDPQISYKTSIVDCSSQSSFNDALPEPPFRFLSPFSNLQSALLSQTLCPLSTSLLPLLGALRVQGIRFLLAVSVKVMQASATLTREVGPSLTPPNSSRTPGAEPPAHKLEVGPSSIAPNTS